MIKYIVYTSAIVLLSCFASCKSSIKPEELYGKWRYLKIEHPNDPQDIIRDADVAAHSPYIQFAKDSSLVIMWDSKALSHGKFIIDGHNINYTESLPDSTTRQFPFWVSKLTDKDLIFETLGHDGARVTAVRE
jgi:hypothetical protein